MEAERTPLASGTLCLRTSKLGWVVKGLIQSACSLSVDEVLEDRWSDQGIVQKNYFGSFLNQSYYTFPRNYET